MTAADEIQYAAIWLASIHKLQYATTWLVEHTGGEGGRQAVTERSEKEKNKK